MYPVGKQAPDCQWVSVLLSRVLGRVVVTEVLVTMAPLLHGRIRPASGFQVGDWAWAVW